MKYLKNLNRFINESKRLFKNNILEEYEIIDFFYDYIDDKKHHEKIELVYYSNLYFFTKELSSKLKDLEHMQISDKLTGITPEQYNVLKILGGQVSKPMTMNDLTSLNLDDILHKDFFIDITSDEFRNKGDLYRKQEEIIFKVGPNYTRELLDQKAHPLYVLFLTILDNSEKGLISHYPIMKLNLGAFENERYDDLLECLSIFYGATGWRPFDGIWVESYIDNHNNIYDYYVAQELSLYNGSDDEYKALCEISLSQLSPGHPQARLLETFL